MKIRDLFEGSDLTNFSRKLNYSDDFQCSSIQLTSLKGAPKKVKGYFDCYGNQLTPLEGAPKEVGSYFDCSSNKLLSLKGAPKEVGSNFYLFR